VIFASNHSCTSLRETPRKAVGDEAIGGEDSLVIVAVSLVSMMISTSDACVMLFGELNSERYSSVHSKRRSRVVAGISAVQNTGHRPIPNTEGSR